MRIARPRQAVRYGHQIMVAHENDDFQVVEQWEPVTEVDVQTPREVYEELSGAGVTCLARPGLLLAHRVIARYAASASADNDHEIVMRVPLGEAQEWELRLLLKL